MTYISAIPIVSQPSAFLEIQNHFPHKARDIAYTIFSFIYNVKNKLKDPKNVHNANSNLIKHSSEVFSYR